MEHTLNFLERDEDSVGICAFPTQTGINTPVDSVLRDFLIRSKRFYSAESLENNEDLWELNCSINEIGMSEASDGNLIGVEVLIRNQDLSELSDSLIMDFREDLLRIFARSEVKRARGSRAAFVTNFENYDHPAYGELSRGFVLVSKSIFYNDYRVMLNYPSLEQEDQMLTDAFDRLHAMSPYWNEFNIEFNVIGETQ